MTEMIPIKDAAERFGISTQTLRNWCKDGRIPGAEQQGRKWVVPEHALPEAPPKPEPTPTVADTSELRPGSDEEIAQMFAAGAAHDTGGTVSAGATEMPAEAFDDAEPEEESTPTLDEVYERLTTMRRQVNELGSIAGDLHSHILNALSLMETLTWDSEVSGQKVPAPVQSEHAAADPDRDALDQLVSGGYVPLETLDEVTDAEPDVELDTDPREVWEAPVNDPREDWEASHE